jgi:hypothetical protein
MARRDIIKRKRRKDTKRQPPLKIPLTFEKAVEGILGLSPEDAKDARHKAAPKK